MGDDVHTNAFLLSAYSRTSQNYKATGGCGRTIDSWLGGVRGRARTTGEEPMTLPEPPPMRE